VQGKRGRVENASMIEGRKGGRGSKGGEEEL
jgi:hypothetical protein